MPNHNREISEFILRGSSIADAARIFGISETNARQIVYRFCRESNAGLYQALIPSVSDTKIPRLMDLQANKHNFLEIEE